MTLPQWEAGGLLDDAPPMNEVPESERLGWVPEDPLSNEVHYATPDPDLINRKRRANGARGYESKVTDILKMGIAIAAPNQATVVDAAAILLHGDKVAYTMGDWAAEDERVAHMIDFLNGGTGNPAVAAVTALLPLALQLIRNHEPELQNITRLSVPFTRGKLGINLPTKIRFKLGRKATQFTNDPMEVYRQAFPQQVIDKLAEQRINVAVYVPRHRSE